jgi:hypothetical protein
VEGSALLQRRCGDDGEISAHDMTRCVCCLAG